MSDVSNVSDEKYLVAKWSDVVTTSIDLDASGFQVPLSALINDAVVIRRQDIFAASTLYSYAQSIRTAVEIMEAMDVVVPQRMMQIADYFMEQADRASRETVKKIPD